MSLAVPHLAARARRLLLWLCERLSVVLVVVVGGLSLAVFVAEAAGDGTTGETVAPAGSNVRQSSVQGQALWREIGPTSISNRVLDPNTGRPDYLEVTGRVNLLDADSTGTLYAGSDGGGVWKSTDAGSSWRPLTDNIPAGKVTALRVDPANTQLVVAGLNSGEHDIGNGLYRSADAGATWTRVGSAVFGTGFISAIRVDPGNDNYVYAALARGATMGVAVSTDKGLTWTDPTASGSLANHAVSDLAIATNGYLFAAVPGEGIYRSTDHGASWALLEVIVSSDTLKIAVAPSNSQVLYVEQANEGYATAILRSTDGGSTWKNICASTSPLCTPGNYSDGSHQLSDYIAVDKTNPNIAFVGLVDLWETTNGTNAAPTWTDALARANVSADSLHVDQRGFVQTSAGLFFANDGGVYRSNDGGQSFLFSGHGLGTVQFHSGSTGSPGSQVIAGGVQDNGVIASPDGSTWTQGLGGDGANALVDPRNSQNLFADINGGDTLFSTDGGSQWTEASPPGLGQDGAYLLAPLVLKPASSTTLYLGARHIWRSLDAARSWQEQGAPPALANAPFVLLAANGSGELFGTDGSHNAVSMDEGNTWQATVTTPCASCSISDVAIDNGGSLYESNIDYSSGVRGQLFGSRDGGASWSEIDATLPPVAFHSVAVDPTSSAQIFVGTNEGVYISRDRGATWQTLGVGFPDVAVYHLAVASDGSALTAFTLGRGAWSVKIPPTVTKVSPTKGPVAGGTSVTITGTNFTGATAVKFGAISAPSLTVKSATTITTVSPAATAGTVDVTVTTPGGTSAVSSADRFKFVPTVTALSPNSGSQTGGTSVTVSGTGFAVGKTATLFKFGSTKATSVNCTSTTTCTVVSPAHAVGVVDVQATVNKVSSAKAPADRFTYN